jgi:hypothetical protein
MKTTLIAFCLLLLCRLPLASAQNPEGATVDEAGLSEQEVQQPDGPEEVVVRLSLQGAGAIDDFLLKLHAVLPFSDSAMSFSLSRCKNLAMTGHTISFTSEDELL